MKRFNALDELRGIAILAMIFAHWGPGLYQRLGVTGFPLDLLHFFGRIATPAFILVFGITIGIAFIPSIRSGNTSITISLLRRSKTVFVAMLIISLPKVIEIAYDNNLEASYFSILLATYSVLTFYTLAIAITALLLSKINEIGFADYRYYFYTNRYINRCFRLAAFERNRSYRDYTVGIIFR